MGANLSGGRAGRLCRRTARPRQHRSAKEAAKGCRRRSVKEEITTIYHENRGRYGYRRITAELRKRNFLLNHKTVQRLMKKQGLVCRVRMKKYCSYKGEVGKTAPNLLNRDFHADKPNQKWVTDVTVWRKALSVPSELLYLQEFQSMEHFKQELIEYMDYYNNRRIKAKRKGLPPAIHRQQALSAA